MDKMLAAILMRRRAVGIFCKKGSNFATFGLLNLVPVKSSELHRKVRKNGWVHIRTEGSHYIYEKEGRTYPVPYHGAKEIGKGLERKIIKEMRLK
jgi:mRNA interferase HicA